MTKAIKLKDDHASSYYLRSLAYEKCGSLEHAKKDLDIAIKLDKASVDRWKNMDPFEVFIDYFACHEGKNKVIKSNISVAKNLLTILVKSFFAFSGVVSLI